MTPTVSILVPVLNQAPAYLRAALLSAKMQTYPCEVVVVDDGSKPRQQEIVADILQGQGAGKLADEGMDAVLQASGVRPNRIIPSRWIYQWQPNGGVASALNKALELSTGQYLQWLPSDDLFHIDKTKIQLEAMQAEDAMISYCAYEEGIPMPVNTWPAAQYPSREKLFAMLCQHSFINAATVMWRRDVFDAVGKWDENIVHLQDTEFILRCAEKFEFLAVNEPLVRRRLHQKQMIHTLKDPAERAKKERDVAYVNERYGASLKVWVPE